MNAVSDESENCSDTSDSSDNFYIGAISRKGRNVDDCFKIRITVADEIRNFEIDSEADVTVAPCSYQHPDYPSLPSNSILQVPGGTRLKVLGMQEFPMQ